MKALKITMTFLALSFLACSNSKESQKSTESEWITLKVKHYCVPCTGVGLQMCYLVQEEGENEWAYSYEGIRGFVYQWGYNYVLKIRREIDLNPPADKSKNTDFLQEIVSSKKVAEGEEFELILKSDYMNPVKLNDEGQHMLIDKIAINCATPEICDQLNELLEKSQFVKGTFNHSDNAISLIKFTNQKKP